MNPHFSRHHRHPSLSKVPIFVLKLVEGTRMHPKNRKFLDIFKFMRSSESNGSKGSVERQCLRANTQSGDITGSPADGCHFGTFDRRILFSELRFRTFAGDRILSTINLGIGIEPIRSRQGFFFSLKNVNVTPVRRCLRSSYAQCRHP